MLQMQSNVSRGLFDWMSENLCSDLRVERLAEQANMSPRNFSRVFTEETGNTPAKAVETMRIKAARELLEESELPVREVAIRCGFLDDERMRRAFARSLHASPNDYRLRFSKTAI